MRLPGAHTGSKRDETRRALLESALNVFGEKGYHNAAVDDIVSRAGRSKGTAYFHFPNKEAIFRALVRELASYLVDRVERELVGRQSAIEQLDAALLSVVNIFTKHRKLARVTLVEVAGAGRAFSDDLLFVRQEFANLIRRHLDAAVNEGTLAPCDTELIAAAWFGAINEIVLRWLHDPDARPLNMTYPALRQLLLQSVGADVAQRYNGSAVAYV
jgi:AcrR family transcriptional regulator